MGLLGPNSAHAEFPFALRAFVGLGIGLAESRGVDSGPFGGVVAADLALRHRSQRAVVVAYDLMGVTRGPGAAGYYGEQPIRLDSAVGHAITLGIARDARRTASGSFFQLGLGVGRADLDRVYPGNDESALGFAVTAVHSTRWAPPPGPVGFLFGVRTTHVFTSVGRAHSLAIVFGPTIHPQ